MAPQGGIYKSWGGGGDTEHLGNWGGMDPGESTNYSH